MIIDCILDRKYADEIRAQGYTHWKTCDGKIEEIKYDPHKFYMEIFGYIGGCAGDAAENITREMDNGTEKSVKQALCKYILDHNYNPDICEYINSREWLTEN